MKKSITIGELNKKLRKEEELFDNSKDIKSKEFHLSNINKLNVRIAQLNVKMQKTKGTYIEEEDRIKAPFDCILKEDDFPSFYYNEDEYLEYDN